MLLSYTLDEYEAEITNAQEAFLAAATSTQPADAAALQALQSSFPTAGFDLRDGTLVRSAFDEHERALLDDVLRLLVVRVAADAVSSGQPIMQYTRQGQAQGELSLMQRLLAMIKWMAQASVVPEEGDKAKGAATDKAQGSSRVLDVATYCKLLEDLLELGTISDCQDVFARIEADLEFLVSEVPSEGEFRPQAAHLTILRACNSLLRRLSKANDVQLCGRILVFIARLYPLSDKSGLNLHAVINSGLPLPIDEVSPDDVDSVGQPIDTKLYTTFWNLQNVYKNPAQLLQAASWSRFKEDLSTVMDAFDSLPITVPATGLGSGAAAASSTGAEHMDVDMAGQRSQGNAATSVKFLTSSKLFGLQLRDGTFRRHFLVQVSALLHFMAYPTVKDKNAAAALSSKAEGLDELNNRVYAALGKIEFAGDQFAESVRAILERETYWVAWKKEGCPPFERPPESSAAAGGAKADGDGAAAAGRPLKRRRGGGGAPRPTFAQMVAEHADQMAGLKADERPNLPRVKDILNPIKEDMDPENDIEETYRRKNDRVFAWKANRVMARTSLGVFANSKDLEEMIMKLDPELKKKVEEYKAAQEERLKQLKEEEEKEKEREKEEKEKERVEREREKEKSKEKEKEDAEVVVKQEAGHEAASKQGAS